MEEWTLSERYTLTRNIKEWIERRKSERSAVFTCIGFAAVVVIASVSVFLGFGGM